MVGLRKIMNHKFEIEIKSAILIPIRLKAYVYAYTVYVTSYLATYFSKEKT